MIVLLYEPMREEFLGGAITVVAMRATVGGRGGTIAAEMTGRSCHAIGISPAYVDVAVQRWEVFTGQAAVLDGDGRAFSEIAEQREKGTA
jgi:hypothetical protein